MTASDGPKMRMGALLLLLALAALVLFPATATESKYAWEESIPVTLEIRSGNQTITSVFPEEPMEKDTADGDRASSGETDESTAFSQGPSLL